MNGENVTTGMENMKGELNVSHFGTLYRSWRTGKKTAKRSTRQIEDRRETSRRRKVDLGNGIKESGKA